MVQSDKRIFSAGKNLHIIELPDRGSDAIWTQALHHSIENVLSGPRMFPIGKVRLYGSRDSSFLSGFDISNLNLPYEKVELLPFSNFSATELRAQVARRFPSGDEMDSYIREGMIIASQMRFASVVSTVDIAILEKQNKVAGIWLGRKPNATQFRFIGGFADPTSDSDEADAAREAEEETNLLVGAIGYIGNANIDDWRYRGEADKIRTRFFAGKVVGSTAGRGPKAKDDIAEIKWIPLKDLAKNPIVSEHGPLKKMFLNWLKTSEGKNFVKNL